MTTKSERVIRSLIRTVLVTHSAEELSLTTEAIEREMEGTRIPRTGWLSAIRTLVGERDAKAFTERFKFCP